MVEVEPTVYLQSLKCIVFHLRTKVGIEVERRFERGGH